MNPADYFQRVMDKADAELVALGWPRKRFIEEATHLPIGEAQPLIDALPTDDPDRLLEAASWLYLYALARTAQNRQAQATEEVSRDSSPQIPGGFEAPVASGGASGREHGADP